jgi:hypothetical protein
VRLELVQKLDPKNFLALNMGKIPPTNGPVPIPKIHESMDWFKGNLQETIDFPMKIMGLSG